MTEGNASAGNLLANLPLRLSEELVEILLSAPGLRVERIVSTGQTSPPDFWYDQDQAEFVVLLQGSARLRFEEETITMTPGSYVSIAARRRHRVEETDVHQPTVWLAIHHGKEGVGASQERENGLRENSQEVGHGPRAGGPPRGMG